MKRYKVIVKQTSQLTSNHSAPCVVCGKNTYWTGEDALCVHCAADPENMAAELAALRAALAQALQERDEWRRRYEQADYLARDAQTERADQAEAERDAALASLAAKPTLSEWAELTQARSFAESALAQAQQDIASQQAEIKELHERLAGENAEVINCLKNIAELVAERRGLQLELSDARESVEYLRGEIEYWKREWAKDEMTIGSDMGRIQARAERDAALEELCLIKQTTRPVPGDLLDEKNQHGEYSMDTPPFDYALYGIAGEPQHDTSGKPCWCGAKADGEGVIVHRDMAEVLTAARQLGRFDAHPDYAAARSAVESELRAIAHIYGTAAGLEPLDSVSGMLSQISNIIAGVASQRDAATARAERLEAAAAGRGMASEMDDGAEVAVLVMGLHDRAEAAEEIRRLAVAEMINQQARAERAEAMEKQAQADRDAALEDAHSARAQIEVERNAQRAIWNELRVLFDCKPNESLVAVCNKTIADLNILGAENIKLQNALDDAVARRDAASGRADRAETALQRVKAERDAATARAERAEALEKRARLFLQECGGYYYDAGLDAYFCVSCDYIRGRHSDDCELAAALAGPEGGER